MRGLLLMLTWAPLAAAQPFAGFEAPMRLVRGHVVADAYVQEIGPYPFVLDTGLRRMVLDNSVANYARLTPETPFIADAPDGEPARVQTTTIDPVRLAGLPPQNERAIVAPSDALSAQLGMRVAGIAPAHQPGYELILDWGARTVRWQPIEQPTLTLDDDTARPLTFDAGGWPQTVVRLDGEHDWAVRIDLAYPGVLALPEEVVRTLGALDPERPRLVTALDPKADTVRRMVRLRSAAIGPATLRQPRVEVVPDEAPARVGTGFLQAFHTTLNFEFGRVRLAPSGPGPTTDGPIHGIGLTLDTLQPGGWRVLAAVDSPAWRAGIRTGDQLIACEGVPAATTPAETLRFYLERAPSQTLRVTLARGTQQATFELTAERLL